MPRLPRASSFFRNLLHKQRVERDLDEEVRAYLDQVIDEKIQSGLSPQEARRRALIELGGVEQVKEQVREVRIGAFLETLINDARLGFRVLRKDRGFTVMAVLTLGLGIGANTAIFSITEATLLRSWQARSPERLVKIVAQTRDGEDTFSFAQYRDLCQQSGSLEGILAYARHGPFLETESGSQTILVETVSTNYFEVLGIPAALGRTFLAQDQPGERLVVISDGLWRRVFHGDPSLIGKTVVLGGGSFTVIGVAPRHVRGFEPAMPTEAWLLAASGENDPSSRGSVEFELIGRMRPGKTAAAVRVELQTIGRRLAEEYPATDKGREIRLITERDRLREALVPTVLAMGSVGLVLLVCCSNLAGLMLARAETRHREMAVRRALGAGRWRVVRQLLTESTLLALTGAGLGLGLTTCLFRLQSALMPPSDVLTEFDLRMDWSLLLFTLLVTVIAVLFFGLTPALQASKPTLVSALKGEELNRRYARFPFAFRDVLVAGEIALSVVLVAASGLLVRSLLYTKGQSPGFGVGKLLLFFQPFPSNAGYDLGPSSQFFQQAKEKVSTLPGVKRVSIARHLMLTDPGGWMTQRVTIPGVELPPDRPNVPIRFNAVDPGYFQTVGTNILKGRDFATADGPAAPGVVLISRTMAGRFWPGSDPVGRHILAEGRDCQVIGVVEDAKISRIHEPPQPYMYFPFSQARGSEATLIAEVAGDELAVTSVIQRAIRKVDPRVPIEVSNLREVMTSALWLDQMAAGFGAVLGSLAVALAAVGLYGVVSYLANRRRKEFGIRMALGASRLNVVQLVVREGLRLSVAGTLVGLPVAVGVTRLMRTILYGVRPGDPSVMAAGTGLVVLVALLAASIPARMATKVDPMVALRYE
ncbi:MAG TPA: ABC transporter permease [Candidatus Sulfotelmatobacter sp.]|nr:ABC transporter permease [Candidatus Sulfotelmatobacter sp.]